MISYFRAPVAALLAGALLCTGCAFRRHVAGMAIEHNDFVALTTNRQTVLNILRASEREPMHFTSFASVGGKVQGGAQLGVNPTFNGDFGSIAQTDTRVVRTNSTPLTETSVTDQIVDTVNRGATNLMLAPQISVQTGTDFQIAVNATHEFYRGILGPLSSGIIIHYLRQGFPPDLLSHLAIGRLRFYAEITVPDGTKRMVLLETLDNTPDEADAIDDFAAALRCRELDYQVEPVAASELQVPVTNLAGLSPDILSRLRMTSGNYFLTSPARNEFRLILSDPDPHRDDCSPSEESLRQSVRTWVAANRLRPRPAAPPAPESTAPTSTATPTPDRLTAEAVVTDPHAPATAAAQDIGGAGFTFRSETVTFDDLLPPGYQGALVLDMTIRSVEGIIYYLGEYIRNDRPTPLLRNDEVCGRNVFCLPIIRVRPAAEIALAHRFVEVAYRGRVFAVPLAGHDLDQESGRSSQAISLVQQLLNLHRSASELPTTQFVRVTN